MVFAHDDRIDFLPVYCELRGLDYDRNRAPAWTVMGLMTTAQSVSPNVTAGSLLFSIIAFGVMYLILGALLVFLFIREIKKGAEHGDHHDVPVTTDPFSQEVYHGISS